MKKLILAAVLFFGANALADHSLASAMGDSYKLKQAVELTMQANNVVCDLDLSNQSYAFPEEQGNLGTAWKQVALCFASNSDLLAARAQMESGNSLGFYGLNGLVGVLVAKYTWENYSAGKVISVSYQ